MIVNNYIITQTFLSWDDLCFGGELVLPRFQLTNCFNVLGHIEIPSDDTNNTVISISRQYDYTQHQLDNIMVHEMIHYYLYMVGRDTRCTHGKEFKKMAKDINSKFGLHVEQYVDISHMKLRKDYSKLHKFFSFLEWLEFAN